MIKKLVTIIVFLIVILTAGILESHYTTSSFDELVDKLCVIRNELSLNKESIDTEENILEKIVEKSCYEKTNERKTNERVNWKIDRIILNIKLIETLINMLRVKNLKL